MRIDEILAARDAGLLVRVLPAQDRGRRAEPVRRARASCGARALVRVGHLRRRRLHAREDDRDRQADQGRVRPGGDGALHLRRRDRARAARDARRDARGRHRQRARAARRPAGGPGGLDEDRGRPRVLARAGRADRAPTTRSRSAPPASPRPTSTPRAPRRTSHYLAEKVRRRRGLPDHAAVLRQRPLLRLRRARARRRRSRCRSSPAIMPITQRRPGRADGEDVRRLDPRGPAHASCTRARRTPRRCSTSASPTPRCSAPSCSPPARRASTSTRSTARPPRARSSAR